MPTLCILGASGDLTSRLLLPGLGTLLVRDPNRQVQIIGADARELSQHDWRDRVTNAFTQAGVQPGTDAAQQAGDATWVTCDVTDDDSMRNLLHTAAGDVLVLYFALPPAISEKAVDTLARIGLPEGTQLAFEKPFGGGYDGAVALNAKLAKLVPEQCIHRVDHFLGTSTVLNLLALRFANRFLQPIWNADDIDHVDIVWDEPLTLEGRAIYYDTAGALVDMVQSHLLQVMAFVAMLPPSRIDAVELREMTTQVLRAAQPWGGDAAKASRRARYTAGSINGRDVPNYVDEPGVDPSRDTETLAEVTLEVQTDQWAGVPFRLRSGKSLGDSRKQIIVTFRQVRHQLEGFNGSDEPDQLIIGLNPDRIELHLTTNKPTDALGLQQSVLSAELSQADLLPYGEVLAGILDGNPMLTVRGDAAEECWRITKQVTDAWASGAVPLDEYAAGTSGPASWSDQP